MSEAETNLKQKPVFEIKDMDDLWRMLTIAKGGDPNAIQAISNFMDLKSNTERANLTDKTLMLCVGQLNGFGQLFYSKDEWDPFTLIGESLSIASMGYKGFKSSQFVDMTRQTPNLDALKTSPEEVKQGVLQRVFGGVKAE